MLYKGEEHINGLPHAPRMAGAPVYRSVMLFVEARLWAAQVPSYEEGGFVRHSQKKRCVSVGSDILQRKSISAALLPLPVAGASESRVLNAGSTSSSLSRTIRARACARSVRSASVTSTCS